MLEINLLDGYNEQKDYYTYPELEEAMGKLGGDFRGKIEKLLKKGKIRVRPRPNKHSHELSQIEFTEYEKLKKLIADGKLGLSSGEITKAGDVQNLRFHAEDVDQWKKKRKLALLLTAFSGIMLFLLAEDSNLSGKLAVWLYGADPTSMSQPKNGNSAQNSQKEELKMEKITTIQAKIAKKRDELTRTELSLGQWQAYGPQTPDDQVQKIIELATLRERIATLHELLGELEQELAEAKKH